METNMTVVYDLTPTDGRKSFYGKARIVVKNGKKTLISYDTPVCCINRRGTFKRYWDEYSATTMRHVNAFLTKYKVECGGKKWWDAQPVKSFKGF